MLGTKFKKKNNMKRKKLKFKQIDSLPTQNTCDIFPVRLRKMYNAAQQGEHFTKYDY